MTHGHCDARPTITFLAAGHRCAAAGSKLYCLATEGHVCEQLAQAHYLAVERPSVELETSRVAIQHVNPLRHWATRLSVSDATNYIVKCVRWGERIVLSACACKSSPRLRVLQVSAARLRFTPIALYTKVDARCNKLATVVDRTKLTTLAMVRTFLSTEFGAKFQRKVHLFSDIPEFLYNTAQDRPREGKSRALPYSLQSVGPGADPGVGCHFFPPGLRLPV